MEDSRTPILVQDGPELRETGLVHRIYLPGGVAPATAVMVHGRKGNEDVMWVFRKAFPRPWLLVAPRAPFVEDEGYSWRPPGGSTWAEWSRLDEGAARLVTFIQALPRVYNSDPSRVYLMGFSQGAAVSFAAALQRPDLVRGIVSLVGFAPDLNAHAHAGPLDGLPVFMAAGTADDTIPLELARKSADVLRTLGADLEYQEYETGHKLTAQGMKDLTRWVHAQEH
ncbi:MAG TPA: alpha/beta fold hydrolase [Promineifilum sp.]